jgi:hypothetical protein
MEGPPCPRCGAPAWGARNLSLPYCNDCGWNLDEVCRLYHKHDRSFAWVVCGFAVVIGIPAIIRNPQKGVLLLVVMLAFSMLAIFSVGRSRSALRLKATRQAVAQRPGSDLSCATPNIMPTGVVGYAEALRAIPRPRAVRLKVVTRMAIAMIRVRGGIFVSVVVHDLLFPAPTIMMISNALSSIGLLLSAAMFWFMVPVPLRKEPRLNLLVNGEVLLARVARVPNDGGRENASALNFTT